MKILIVDGDAQVHELLRDTFARHPILAVSDLKVVGAYDGVEAMEAFRREDVDVVIVESRLTALDGLELCRLIRAHARGRDVPLIVTGVGPQLAEQVRQEFGAEFCAKPLHVHDLVRSILALCAQTRPKALGSTSRPRGVSTPPAQARRGPVTRSGDLAKDPVARVLLAIHEAGDTGALLLNRGQLRRILYFIEGALVYADSNVRAETLGEFLVAREILKREQVDQALQLAQLRRVRLGEALVQLQFVTEQAAMDHISAQVQMKVGNSLRWREGSFEFQSGDAFVGKIVRCSVNLPRLVFMTLARVSTIGIPRGHLRFSPRHTHYRNDLRALYSSTLLDRLERRFVSTDPPDEDLRDPVRLSQLRALYEAGLLAVEVPEGQAKRLVSSEPEPDAEVWETSVSLRTELFSETGLPSGITLALRGEREEQDYTPKERAARKLILGAYLSAMGSRPSDVLGVGTDAKEAEIEQAFRQKEEQFALSRFEGLNLGPERTKLEELVATMRRAYEHLRIRRGKGEEDEPGRGKVTTQTRAQRAIQAELLFREGERILQEQDATRAEPYFRTAVAMAQHQADYHAYWGWTLYLMVGGGGDGAAAAGPRMEEALALNPDNPAAREFGGRIAFENGVLVTAQEHFERLLDINPSHPQVIDWLEDICRRLNKPEDLERVYRRAIQLLKDRLPARSAELLLRLAEHFRSRHDEASASLALEAAARIGTTDERLAKSPTLSKPPSTQTLEDRGSSALLGEFRRLKQVGSKSRALRIAAVLLERGSEEAEVIEYHRLNRPKLLSHAVGLLEPARLALYRHPDDDARREAELVDRAASLRGEEPVLSPSMAGEAQLSPLFSSVLSHVARCLGVDAPFVRSTPHEEFAGWLLDTEPPSLVMSRSALGTTDKIRLACLLARELYYLAPGRALIAGRAPDLLSDGGPVEIWARHVSGTRKTAMRLALLVGGDYRAAVSVAGGEPQILSDLESVALSESFDLIKEKLGLGKTA